MNKTIIVIPTLNEYENVEILLDEFVKLDVDVVFIDDNSINTSMKPYYTSPLLNYPITITMIFHPHFLLLYKERL